MSQAVCFAEAEAESGTGDREPDLFGGELLSVQNDLWQRAYFLTRDRADAEDLVQTTMERALTARPQFRPGTNLRAWVGTILRNAFVDWYRRSLRSVPMETEPAWIAPADPVGPLDILTATDVAAATSTLPAHDRQILGLAQTGLAQKAIATHLGIPVGTVATRLFRARAKLRRVLVRTFEARSREMPYV
ncbi:MAG TPA: RNA polymerase sigma factor [Polyangia bacterium]|nr:RNA polymerase sigma factor [Polyangia bacterium]